MINTPAQNIEILFKVVIPKKTLDEIDLYAEKQNWQEYSWDDVVKKLLEDAIKRFSHKSRIKFVRVNLRKI